MKKKIVHRFLTVVTAVALLASELPYASLGLTNNVVSVAAAEVADSQDEAGEIIYTDIPAPQPEILEVVDSQPSATGHVSTKLYHEDGTEYIPDLIPDSVDMVMADTIPAYYNLRDKKLVATAVENQGQTGTCWAHAACAAAESNMIINNLADTSINLSEAHLTWFSLGKGPTDTKDPLYGDCKNLGTNSYQNGGNATYAGKTFSRGSGVQLESQLPDATEAKDLSGYESQRYASIGLLVNSDLIEIQDASQRNAVKQKLMTTGAMILSVDYEDDYISSDDLSFYAPNSSTDSCNHDITLVGWDDNYSKSKFGTTPAGDGAWICKNSWGDGAHDGGYFYISYYDTSICDATSMEIKARNAYGDKIYQYAGDYNSASGYPSSGLSLACIYTAESNTDITAVGFDTSEASVPYTIEIYTGVQSGNPVSGTKVYTTEGTFDYAGYHVVDLEKPQAITTGTNFSVVVIQKKNGVYYNIDSHQGASGKCFYASYNVSTNKSSSFSKTNGFDVNIKVLTAGVAQDNSDTLKSIDNVSREYPYGVDLATIKSNLPAKVSIKTEKGLATSAEVKWNTDTYASGSYTVGAREVQNFTYKGTVTLPSNVSAGSVSTTVTASIKVAGKSTVDLVSIVKPTALEFDNGTAATVIKNALPETVSINIDNGESKTVAVTWDTSRMRYDASSNSEQNFTISSKDITLPSGVTNTNKVSLRTSIDITVKAPAEEKKCAAVTITGVANDTEYTDKASFTLATTTAGATIYYTIDGRDPAKYGKKYTSEVDIDGVEGETVTYTIKAIAVMNGYVNSDAATWTIKIKKKYTLASISELSDLEFPNGVAESVITSALPSTVGLVTINGDKLSTGVTGWTGNITYDNANINKQEITYTGTVSCPDNVDANEVSLTATIKVVVKAKETEITTAKLISITNPADLEFDNGATLSTILAKLREINKVNIVLENSANAEATVSWPEYDLYSNYYAADTNEQTITLTGNVTLPEGVDNRDGKQLTATINITVKAQPAVPAPQPVDPDPQPVTPDPETQNVVTCNLSSDKPYIGNQTITFEASKGGTIYFTCDGSDPRKRGCYREVYDEEYEYSLTAELGTLEKYEIRVCAKKDGVYSEVLDLNISIDNKYKFLYVDNYIAEDEFGTVDGSDFTEDHGITVDYGTSIETVKANLPAQVTYYVVDPDSYGLSIDSDDCNMYYDYAAVNWDTDTFYVIGEDGQGVEAEFDSSDPNGAVYTILGEATLESDTNIVAGAVKGVVDGEAYEYPLSDDITDEVNNKVLVMLDIEVSPKPYVKLQQVKSASPASYKTSSSAISSLPTTIDIVTERNDITKATVVWDTTPFSKYDPALGVQTFLIKGELTLPEGVYYNAEETSLTVYMCVTLGLDNGVKQLQTPLSNLKQDIYSEDVTLQLTAIEGDIYYTLDGTDPATKGTKYTEGVKLTGTLGEDTVYKIRAIARKEGCADSPVYAKDIFIVKKASYVSVNDTVLTFDNGTKVEDIIAKLPATVSVVDSAKKETAMAVTWTTEKPATGTYDPALKTKQEFTYEGSVVCGDDLEPVTLKAVAKITVEAVKSYTVTFDADGGVIEGKNTITLTPGEKMVWPELPFAYVADAEFICWTYGEKDIYEGDDASWVNSDITLKAAYSNIYLWIGQKCDITDAFADIINENPDLKFRVKMSNSKASVKYKNGGYLVTAKKAGVVTAYLQYKEGKKWYNFEEAPEVNIQIAKPKLVTKTLYLDETEAINIDELLSDYLPNGYYNDIYFDVKNPKKYDVLDINPDTGDVSLLDTGSATLIVTLTRDGSEKTFKFKIKVK